MNGRNKEMKKATRKDSEVKTERTKEEKKSKESSCAQGNGEAEEEAKSAEWRRNK
jgi:hypothetical protein